MLAAERHGKISSGRPAHDRMEDVLTSDVFSTFRYFRNLEIQGNFLRRAVNLQGEYLRVGRLQDASVVFWPKFALGKGRREADVLLLLQEADEKPLAVVVEAKHEAGLHNLDGAEHAGEEEALVSSGHQLADEWASLNSTIWYIPQDASRQFWQSRRVLLYVTAHHEMPKGDLEEAVRVAGAASSRWVTGSSPQTDIYWVGWRVLHSLLVSGGNAGFPGYSPGERSFLEDLREVLALRRLREFQPFQGLQPIGPYDRLMQLLPRFERLNPVVRYHPLFGTS
jgi:hypothetical protein